MTEGILHTTERIGQEVLRMSVVRKPQKTFFNLRLIYALNLSQLTADDSGVIFKLLLLFNSVGLCQGGQSRRGTSPVQRGLYGWINSTNRGNKKTPKVII